MAVAQAYVPPTPTFQPQPQPHQQQPHLMPQPGMLAPGQGQPMFYGYNQHAPLPRQLQPPVYAPASIPAPGPGAGGQVRDTDTTPLLHAASSPAGPRRGHLSSMNSIGGGSVVPAPAAPVSISSLHGPAAVSYASMYPGSQAEAVGAATASAPPLAANEAVEALPSLGRAGSNKNVAYEPSSARRATAPVTEQRP
jgi:hypothetical protein